MDTHLIRQIRLLQIGVLVLSILTLGLCWNIARPFLPLRTRVIDAERLNIRERDGTLKAVLANSATYSEAGDRAKQGGVPFSGLIFYNQEGDEEGGLVYDGKSSPGGQHADVSLTFDQFRQDQNVVLHHEETKSSEGAAIIDGLAINSRPDWTAIREELKIYKELKSLSAEQQANLRLKALHDGKISTQRLFLGERRGIETNQSYDEAGLFIKNRLGRDAIRLFVDSQNVPHFEVYDQFGHPTIYEFLKQIPAR